jgi:hypothetical protein
MRGGDQRGVAGLAEAAPLAGAAPMQQGPVEHATPMTGPQAYQRAMDSLPARLPDTPTIGVWPRGAQVRAFGGRKICPVSSSKTIHAPVAAARPFRSQSRLATALPAPPPLVRGLP